MSHENITNDCHCPIRNSQVHLDTLLSYGNCSEDVSKSGYDTYQQGEEKLSVHFACSHPFLLYLTSVTNRRLAPTITPKDIEIVLL